MALNLTSLEKKAVSKVMFEIINADGKVTQDEILLFKAMRDVLEISDSELKEVQFMTTVKSLAIIKNMLPSNKILISKLMLEMISVDGQVDDDEIDVYKFVCLLTEIPISV